MRKQRWGRPEALAAAAQYNALAREHGLTPTQLALAFCYTNWRVTSTIIGVTTQAQLDEDLEAWGTELSPELLARDRRDPLDPSRPGAVGGVATARQTRQRDAGHRSGCARMASPSANTSTTTSSTAAPAESARQLGVDEHAIVKTLVMQDERRSRWSC